MIITIPTQVNWLFCEHIFLLFFLQHRNPRWEKTAERTERYQGKKKIIKNTSSLKKAIYISVHFFIICLLHALPGSAGFGTFWSNVSTKDTITGSKCCWSLLGGCYSSAKSYGLVDKTWKDPRAWDRAKRGHQTASLGRESSFHNFHIAVPKLQ